MKVLPILGAVTLALIMIREANTVRAATPSDATSPANTDDEQRSRLGLQTAAAWTETPKRLLVLRVDFPEQPGEVPEAETIRQRLNGPISDFFRRESRGKLWIEADCSESVQTRGKVSWYLRERVEGRRGENGTMGSRGEGCQ